MIGHEGEPPENPADVYRERWSQGLAGIAVKRQMLQGTRLEEIPVTSMHREDDCRGKQAF